LKVLPSTKARRNSTAAWQAIWLLLPVNCLLNEAMAGVVSFIAKTQLIEHYRQTLGAKLFAGNRMFIDTPEALTLVTRYFKGFDYGKL
jgi:hypothetical protein